MVDVNVLTTRRERIIERAWVLWAALIYLGVPVIWVLSEWVRWVW